MVGCGFHPRLRHVVSGWAVRQWKKACPLHRNPLNGLGEGNDGMPSRSSMGENWVPLIACILCTSCRCGLQAEFHEDLHLTEIEVPEDFHYGTTGLICWSSTVI